jgi:Mrp family chromosome partitioning ATPase
MSGLFDALVRARASEPRRLARRATDVAGARDGDLVLRAPGAREVPGGDGEAYEAMHRALALESGGRPGRTIMLVSTLPGEGVTTVARGLGAALAREGRVLVADVAAERARFLAAGAGEGGARGRDWPEAFREALAVLGARVDRILLDAGALHSTPELLTLVRHVDTVVLVVAAQHAPILDVARTRHRLEQAGACIAGVVLTGYHEHVPRALRRRGPRR